MGGADAVVEKARASYDAGDYRWVAEVLNHVVFAEPDHPAARSSSPTPTSSSATAPRTAPGATSTCPGATELRDGSFGTPTQTAAPDVIANLTPEMLFDAIAVQVDGPKAWDEKLTIDIALDDGARYRLRLARGVLTYSAAAAAGDADLTLALPGAALPLLAAGGLTPEVMRRAGIKATGDASALQRLVAVLDPGDDGFAIVTPDADRPLAVGARR